MQLTLEDIPSVTGSQPHGAEPVKRREPRQPRWNRRGFLKVAVASGTGLGLAALGVLPPARRAEAHFKYIYNACPGYAAGHDCYPGCGPSPLCSDCCTPSCSSQPCTCSAWFKTSGSYRSRQHACVTGQHYDGWNWRYNAGCGCCRNNITFRCHDGSKYISGTWYPRICKSIIGCGICNCN